MNRGGCLRILSASASDPLWLPSDYGRAAALEARWVSLNVPAEERTALLPCAVWLAKFPGTQYSDAVMARLSELKCTN
jgi:hypothetical protein